MNKESFGIKLNNVALRNDVTEVIEEKSNSKNTEESVIMEKDSHHNPTLENQINKH